MQYVDSTMFVVVGLIHLLPLIGVLGSERLAPMYGVDCSERNLSMLMRHCAVLFGVLGSLFHVAGSRIHYRDPISFS